MKSVHLFICNHCGTQYKEKDDCKKCETSHIMPIEIKQQRFHAQKDTKNYPDKIEIKMADGKTVWYRR